MTDSRIAAPSLGDEMVLASYGDVMHTHPYERSLTEVFAEDVLGHRCVVRISIGHVAMIGYEIATGRIVGTIASRGVSGRRPERMARFATVAELIAKANHDDTAEAAGGYGLGDAIRNHFLLDGHLCPVPSATRPPSRSLNRHLTCWRVLEDVASRLDRAVIELPLPYTATPRGYAWLARQDALRPARHDIMRRFWFAGDEILRIRDEVDIGLAAGMPAEEIVLTALCERHAGFRARSATRRSRRRLLGVLGEIAAYPSEDRFLCFRALRAFVEAGLPWDRLPAGCGDWTGLSGIQVLADGLEPRDPALYARMLDVPGGRYRELWDRFLSSPLGQAVREGILQAGWVQDLPSGETEGNIQVNLPHDAAGEANRIVARCADFLLLPLSRLRGLGLDREAALGIAAGIVLRDRSVMGVAEAWSDWMRLQPAMSEALAAMAEGNAMRWQALTARNPLRRKGLDLLWLTTPGELLDEGERRRDRAGVRGLDHCVATYMDDALSGRSHILSIRRTLPDGSWERLSTVEFAGNRDEDGLIEAGVPEYGIVQHRGLGNGEPPREATAAAKALLRDLNAGRVRVSPELDLRRRVAEVGEAEVDPETAMSRLVRDEAGIAAMLRVFEPMFARGLRGLGIDGFAAAVLDGRRW